MNSIKFGKSKINYKIKRSSRRKTTEIVVSKSGVGVITTKKKPVNQINKLVKIHSKWIFQKKLRIGEEKPIKTTFQHNSKLPYLGKNYPLIVKETKQKESFQFSNGKFIAHIHKASKYRVRKLYQIWIKNKAKLTIPKHVLKFSKKLGFPINQIIIKDLSDKWGIVSKSGKITLNQVLIRAPPQIIDYVAAHEACHLRIPNHHEDFWNLLESIMPDFDERKEWLRVNRRLLTI